MTAAQLIAPAQRLLRAFGMRPVHAETAPAHRGGFHFRYDEDADLLFARCGEPEPCDNVQVDDNVVVRVSRATHEPVGIEVIAVTERFNKDRGAITRGFARELLAQYGPSAAYKLRNRR